MFWSNCLLGGWVVGWLAGVLVGWVVGWLLGWVGGWLVDEAWSADGGAVCCPAGPRTSHKRTKNFNNKTPWAVSCDGPGSDLQPTGRELLVWENTPNPPKQDTTQQTNKANKQTNKQTDRQDKTRQNKTHRTTQTNETQQHNQQSKTKNQTKPSQTKPTKPNQTKPTQTTTQQNTTKHKTRKHNKQQITTTKQPKQTHNEPDPRKHHSTRPNFRGCLGPNARFGQKRKYGQNKTKMTKQ